MKTKQILVKTLGCKANLHDSQVIETEFQKLGWDSGGENPDVCVVNGCTVTNEADKQSKLLAKRLAKKYPQSKIVFTGCGAEVNPGIYVDLKEIDYIIGNQNKKNFVSLVTEAEQGKESRKVLGTVKDYDGFKSQHPIDREWQIPTQFEGSPFQLRSTFRTRAFLKIQEGCNSFCTFCIIPYGRGPRRSLTKTEVIRKICQLVESGVQEVVLTGTNLGDFGEGQSKSDLSRLVERILSETELKRLRVSSLDPVEIDEALISLMEGNSRFCPHFHVSLQSPSSKILRRMKRNYRFEDVEKSLHRIHQIRTPFRGGVFVGMDVITGFPGEKREDFDWSVKALSDLPWTRLHVFPYSERTGTPATRLSGSVPMRERKERSRQLMELSISRQTDHYRAVEKFPLTEVLLEGPSNGPAGSGDWLSGYTPNYLRVLVKKTPENDLMKNQLTSIMPNGLFLDRNGGDICFLGDLIVDRS